MIRSVALLFLVLGLAQCWYEAFRGIPGDYCRFHNPTCCPERNDACTVPIMGTLCYCDVFCDRPDGGDCCPDFYAVCRNEPAEFRSAGCDHRTEACLIQPDLMSQINRGSYTWRAQNHSVFWPLTLQNGLKFRTGTLYPERSVENMNEVVMRKKPDLPLQFDARDHWPGLIHAVRDQGNCASSWAFSTTAVAADRVSIQSRAALYVEALSPQLLLSCNQWRQKGCDGGYLDRAWHWAWKYGIVSEDCYPYRSGMTNQGEQCLINKPQYKNQWWNEKCPSGSGMNKAFKVTPPYRLPKEEDLIRKEIIENGPVQATFLVHEDFFMYGGGVYQHTELADRKGAKYTGEAYHSVRIIGWGEEGGTNYWLCANSWGPQWGEEGYFRVLRGENHCQIESFVLGAWGRGGKRRRRKHRLRRKHKLRRF